MPGLKHAVGFTRCPLLVTIFIGWVSVALCEQAAESRLYDRLFSGYNPKIAPVMNSGDVVNVSVSFSLVNLLGMNCDESLLDTITWIYYEWNDPRLSWNKGAYGGVDRLSLPASDIWRPDMSIYNSVTPLVNLVADKFVVDSSGLVYYVPAYRLRTVCACGPGAAHQLCPIKLASWTETANRIDLHPQLSRVELTHYVANRKWEITNTTLVRQSVTYECCSGAYVSIVAGLEFKGRGWFRI